MSKKRILSVGQCAADDGGIRWAIQAHFPDAEVTPVSTRDEALAHLHKESADVVLVNRIFDADGDSGIALIEQMKQDAALSEIPVLLVSNYEDAQQQAENAGALPGFGKSSLGQPAMVDALKAVLGANS